MHKTQQIGQLNIVDSMQVNLITNCGPDNQCQTDFAISSGEVSYLPDRSVTSLCVTLPSPPVQRSGLSDSGNRRCGNGQVLSDSLQLGQ